MVGCAAPAPTTDPAVATAAGASAIPQTPAPAVASPPGSAPPPVGRSLATVPAVPAVSPPVRVEISSVGIDARVDPVGIADDGQMALPPDPDVMGWYRFGPPPGALTGSAVLGGHLDSRTYGVGQLVRLRDAGVGAEVVVSSADGRRTRYRITAVERFEKAALPVAELFRRAGQPVLVLVTCGGDYRPDLVGYEENLVVTAVPA